jgi:hypothetical protein
MIYESGSSKYEAEFHEKLANCVSVLSVVESKYTQPGDTVPNKKK